VVVGPLETSAVDKRLLMLIFLGITIIDAVLNIFRSDMSNYFIVQQLQSLSYFVEKITEKKEDVQVL
jgi:hypothetical protein